MLSGIGNLVRKGFNAVAPSSVKQSVVKYFVTKYSAEVIKDADLVIDQFCIDLSRGLASASNLELNPEVSSSSTVNPRLSHAAPHLSLNLKLSSRCEKLPTTVRAIAHPARFLEARSLLDDDLSADQFPFSTWDFFLKKGASFNWRVNSMTIMSQLSDSMLQYADSNLATKSFDPLVVMVLSFVKNEVPVTYHEKRKTTAAAAAT